MCYLLMFHRSFVVGYYFGLYVFASGLRGFVMFRFWLRLLVCGACSLGVLGWIEVYGWLWVCCCFLGLLMVARLSIVAGWVLLASVLIVIELILTYV